jgi:hypothetical protein
VMQSKLLLILPSDCYFSSSLGAAVARFYATHTDEEGAVRSFQIMFYVGEQCVEVTEVIQLLASACFRFV